MILFNWSNHDILHRVGASTPRERCRSRVTGARHKGAQVVRGTSTNTQGESLVNKLLYNAASLLHLDRSSAHCIQCKGSGFEACPSCKGSGIHGKHVSGGLETNRCLSCHGRGVCPCPQCQGTGRR